jgi:hypothetical protein
MLTVAHNQFPNLRRFKHNVNVESYDAHIVIGSHNYLITYWEEDHIFVDFFDALVVKDLEFFDHYQMQANVEFFMQPQSKWNVAERIEIIETEFHWYILQWYKDEVLVSHGSKVLTVQHLDLDPASYVHIMYNHDNEVLFEDLVWNRRAYTVIQRMTDIVVYYCEFPLVVEEHDNYLDEAHNMFVQIRSSEVYDFAGMRNEIFEFPGQRFAILWHGNEAHVYYSNY